MQRFLGKSKLFNLNKDKLQEWIFEEIIMRHFFDEKQIDLLPQ